MSAPHEEKRGSAAALDDVATAQALPRLWVMSLPDKELLDDANADTCMVALRAVSGCLEFPDADKSVEQHFSFVRGLVVMTEGALWQQIADSTLGKARVEDLLRIARLALKYLAHVHVALTASQAKGVAA